MANNPLKKVSDYASGLYSQGKALMAPEDSEAKSFAEKQAMVSSALPKVMPDGPKPVFGSATAPVDRVNPTARYGTKSGEVRLPSYGNGTPYVPEDQVALIHEGEQVVPAEENPNNPSNFVEQASQNPTLDEHQDRIDNQAHDAASNGDIAGMVNAAAQQHFVDRMAPIAEPKNYVERPADVAPEVSSVLGSAVPKQAPALFGSAVATPVYTGPGKAVTPGEPIPAKELLQDEFKFENQNYDKAIQYARATGNEEAADKLELAKIQYDKANPWGSAANHPGILGKVGHYLAKAGNIAGDVFIPRVMADIPGTDLNNQIKQRGLVKQIGEDEAANDRRNAEQTNARLAGAKTPPEQVMHDLLTGNNGQPRINPDTNKPYTAGEAYEHIQELTQGVKPVDQSKQPIGSEGVTRHSKELATLTEGMSPAEKQSFLDAYSVQPNDTLSNQTKRLEDAKASAQLSGGERDRAVQRDIAKQNHADSVAERQEARESVRVAKEVTAHDKAYVQPAEAVEKSYDMMDNAYREYEEAKAQGKELPTGAQSMLALSTHLSTTFGNVKGARITKDMIQEHLGARGVSDKALVAIQKLTNGDVLSPDQWDAFHQLIGESRILSWQTAVKEAERKHIPIDFLPDGLSAVQVPGHQPGVIPSNTLKDFHQKYPNATDLQ